MSLVSATDSNNVFEVNLPRLIKFGVNMERIDSDVKVFNDIPFDSVLKKSTFYVLDIFYRVVFADEKLRFTFVKPSHRFTGSLVKNKQTASILVCIDS